MKRFLMPSVEVVSMGWGQRQTAVDEGCYGGEEERTQGKTNLTRKGKRARDNCGTGKHL